jgi:hypothetical protein
MIEMSGKEKFKFINDILYVYNESNPINDHKVDIRLTIELANKIRNKKPYNKII